MMKNRKATRLLSFLLALLLVLGDGSMQYVVAAGTVSGSDIVTDTEQTAESLAEEIAAEDAVTEETDAIEEPKAEVAVVEAETYTATVSDGNIPKRQPEDFYEEPEPENYGTLVNYDEYSRTYHVDGNQYVTVIGNDGSTYVDGLGRL